METQEENLKSVSAKRRREIIKNKDREWNKRRYKILEANRIKEIRKKLNHSNIELKKVEKNCETGQALQKKQGQIGEETANELKTDRQF